MELEEAVISQMMDNARKRIDFIHNKLNEGIVKVKFPLDLFNIYFAPYFFGQKPITEDTDIFATWIGIAGSPTSEVDVVDISGKIVFTVPPLFNTDVIDILKKNSELSRTIENYNNYSNALPAVAMGFVKNNLLPAADNALNASHRKNDLSGWAAIAQYYIKPEEKQQLSQGISNINNADDTDLNYDI